MPMWNAKVVAAAEKIVEFTTKSMATNLTPKD